MKRGKGALFFSKEQPEICGHLVINGDDYAIVGWYASPIRANIEAVRVSDHEDGSGAGAGERDIAGG
jgi:hypothetical protein